MEQGNQGQTKYLKDISEETNSKS